MSNQQIQILISARDKATKVIRGVSKHFKKLGKVAKKVGKGIGMALGRVGKSLLSFKTGLIAVAGVAGMGLMIKSSIQVIDKLGKVSSKLGVTSQELQRFRFAAKLAGVEETALDMGLQRFIRRVGEAAQGTGEAKDALKKMGIQLTNSNGRVRSATDLLGQVSEALKKTKDPAERLRLAFKLFDSEGVAMVNMLKGGKTALNSTMMEADKLGFVLSDRVVENIQKANDAWFKMGKALNGVKDNMTGALAPALDKFGAWWSKWLGTFSVAIQPAFDWITTLLEKMTVSFGGAEESGRKWGETVRDWLIETTESIRHFFTEMKNGKTDWQVFKEDAKSAFTLVKQFATDVWNIFKSIVSAIGDAAVKLKAFQRARQRGEGFWHSVGAGLGASELSKEELRRQIDSGKTIGSRASGGGISANQSYLVGERGAEMFTPTTSGRISPNAGGSANVTNIYTNATAHGINNALGSRGDNVSRGARVGMNIARATGMGGYGNLSMARSR